VFPLDDHQLLIYARERKIIVVFLVELKNLDAISEAEGPAAADQTIRLSSEAFRSCFRGSDIVGRVGLHQFAVALLDCRKDFIEPIFSRLSSKLEDINKTRQGHLAVEFKLGMAIAEPGSASGISQILSAAERAAERPTAG
ncbi:MAG: diguanylate cyclase, partial [Candidatus Omnitrophica bacterium]|nr:diguanylate cyclase [Candidatus Omnitrophota bacterium]